MRLKRSTLFYIVPALLLSALLFLVSKKQEVADSKTTASSDPVASSVSNHNHSSDREKPQPQAQRVPQSSQTHQWQPPKFDYHKELETVDQLAQAFPKSKPRLIEITLREDVFKENEMAKPHTSMELLQNRMGAVKVMALREIMTRESNTQILQKDLMHIARNAKDPTIAKIAGAAAESLADDRSFFDDFLDGIDRLKAD